MIHYWLIISATLGLAMTLIAVMGLCLVAGLRWALTDDRWRRSRLDTLAGNARIWWGRVRSLARLVYRGFRPELRGYRR